MAVDDAEMSLEEYRAFAEFRYVLRRFLNFSETAARSASIEPQQHQLLLALKGLPPDLRPTIGTLAERLQLRHNSTVELAQRSIESGLVQRRSSPHDGREVLLSITARGERLLQKLSVEHRAEMRSAAPALIQALRRLIEAGEAPAAQAREHYSGDRPHPEEN
ncbi:MAG TPA: MarR family transcriptional regulator [Polyangiaceae bacterium]|jgi:DNA-binding MarR family transcriptional regulator|nr:MarR family transcriptional regulator [Polyangiaceae bacterium]